MTEEQVRQMAEIDQRAKSNTRRIDKLEERMDKQDALTATMASLQTEMANMMTTVSEIKDAVKKIQETPSRWWEKLIAAVLTAGVGYLLALATGGAS